ncbi:MAG: hypothetical protein LCH82_03760 [Actinobacteria bacterium]|nr:hypothetical protein [Actinomycetota bacterium]
MRRFTATLAFLLLGGLGLAPAAHADVAGPNSTSDGACIACWVTGH